MKSKIVYGFYKDDDFLKMKSLLVECGLYFASTETRKHLKEKIKRDPKSILTAFDGKKMVGTISLVEDGRMPFVFRLGVGSEYRNQGLGSELLKRGEAILKQKGYKEVFMFVDEKNKSLQKYYSKRKYNSGHTYRFMYKTI